MSEQSHVNEERKQSEVARVATRPRRGDDAGAAAVEFALVMPLLFLLVFGIIDFGRAYQAKVELTHASREGVRVWALTQDAVAAGDRTRAAAPSLELASTAAFEVTTTTTTCTFGQATTLTASYQFSYITPLSSLMAALPGGSALASPVTLTESGVMRCSG